MTLSPMPHKPTRQRRTRVEMDRVHHAMVSLAKDNAPLSVRQLYYLLVSAGVIDKTNAQYKQTVVRLALDLRKSGAIPWESVVDQSRWMLKPTTFDSLEDALEAATRLYRRSLWTDAKMMVQVWCESMSVAGIIMEETKKWDVPLYPVKGYPSHDFLRNAARGIAHGGKSTTIYLLGDYDPSGRDIIRFASESIREYADEVDPSVAIKFETIAVTEKQITEWSLPSHPAKKTDSRHARYGIDRAVELEAIPPVRLRRLVSDRIERHLNPFTLRRIKAVEAAERETLRAIALKGGDS